MAPGALLRHLEFALTVEAGKSTASGAFCSTGPAKLAAGSSAFVH